MITWYTLTDVTYGYRITEDMLRTLAELGRIDYVLKPSNSFLNEDMMLIPDYELVKLTRFRREGEYPRYRECHQPKHFRSHDEVKHSSFCEDETFHRAKQEKIRVSNESAGRGKYMESEAWQRKRLEVFERDDYRCVRCGSGKNLCVHHLTYDNYGHEPLEDLITLCKVCHYEIHQKDLRRQE